MFSLISIASLSAKLRESADAFEAGTALEWDRVEWLALPDVAYPYSRFCIAYDEDEIPREVKEWYEERIEPVAFEQAGGITDMTVLRLRAATNCKIRGKVLASGRGVPWTYS
ncbi:hypothetical protein HYS84_02310 [Candidatus Saccharibacteria bacterium]|nr:hypothetical protein [Candidatus Saccharibacteria bacterium]